MDVKKISKSDNSINMSIVTTPEQFMQAMAIRAICFMEQPGITYKGAIDGNDYQSTHILAYNDKEPIGATRIRWFKDFAKIERTAFRADYRSPRILKQCSNFIFDHVAMKGYNMLITHANPSLARVWQMVLGFELVKEKQPFVSFDGDGYVELVKHIKHPTNALNINTDPTILLRVEGQWDTAHPLEMVK